MGPVSSNKWVRFRLTQTVCITALAAVGGGLVNLGLYMWNTSSSGETIDAGEAALAFGTGALASGALMVGAATGSGTLMLAGLGGMAGSDGYMLGNILTGNEFDAVDYTIATGYGAIGAAAGPEVATTKGAAIAYGATVNLLQYGMTEVAHGRKGTLNGAAWALGSGAVGGFFGGPYPESIPQQAISAISNGWSVAPLGSQLVHQTLMDMPSRQFAGNVAKAFGAGIASNYPPQWPQLFSPTKSIHLSGGSGQPMQMK